MLAMEPWILTATGRSFDLLCPGEGDIAIEDIAHALSMLCRFNGHTWTHYSVAQHCVHVSEIVEDEHALVGLLHDAAEAYVGDMSSPLKAMLTEYQALELVVLGAVFRTFGLPLALPAAVRHADLVLLASERRDLLPKGGGAWSILDGIEPLPWPIQPWSPEVARRAFLQRFAELRQ